MLPRTAASYHVHSPPVMKRLAPCLKRRAVNRTNLCPEWRPPHCPSCVEPHACTALQVLHMAVIGIEAGKSLRVETCAGCEHPVMHHRQRHSVCWQLGGLILSKLQGGRSVRIDSYGWWQRPWPGCAALLLENGGSSMFHSWSARRTGWIILRWMAFSTYLHAQAHACAALSGWRPRILLQRTALFLMTCIIILLTAMARDSVPVWHRGHCLLCIRLPCSRVITFLCSRRGLSGCTSHSRRLNKRSMHTSGAACPLLQRLLGLCAESCSPALQTGSGWAAAAAAAAAQRRPGRARWPARVHPGPAWQPGPAARQGNECTLACARSIIRIAEPCICMPAAWAKA